MSKPIRPAVDVDLSDSLHAETIESVEALPSVVNDDTTASHSRSGRLSKFMWLTAGAVVSTIAAVQWAETYTALAQVTDYLAYAFTGLTALLFATVSVSVIRSLSQGRQLKRAQVLREKRIGSAVELSKQLDDYFAGASKSAQVRDALAQLPDYFTEQEARHQLQATVMKDIDQEASRLIARHAQDNALMVAVSPFVWLDMTLSLWRSSKMIGDVGALYGVQATGLLRFKIYREVLKAMVFAGATEAVIHQLPWASSLLGRVGQGAGVAIYTARIGVHTAKICRPLALPSDNNVISIGAISKQVLPVF